jgi:CRISPR-associated protein Csm1
MNREMILWTSFFHHCEYMGKGFQLPDRLGTSKKECAGTITRADLLSGGEREETGTPLNRTQLVSIFSKVNLEPAASPIQEGKDSQRRFIPFTPLANDKSVFPVEKSRNPEAAAKQFDTLMEAFTKELTALLEHKEKSCFDTFYYLAQKYLWCIPSPHDETEPHVSLFEHLKATAAAAAILHDSGGKEEFALVGFDISGIQDFIYTITAKGAAKSLKGRSFYLQLLEMAVSRFIMDRLDLPVTNVVYTGGGKGVLLAPASKKEKLEEIETRINTFLFERMDMKVSVGTACETFDGEGFKRFNTILGELFHRLQQKKKQKFAAMLKDREKYNFFFTPSTETGGSCPICGKEGTPEETDEEGNRCCSQCLLLKNLGTWLRDTVAILETTGKEKRGRTVTFNFGEDSGDYNYDYTFLVKSESENPPPGKMLYCLNDTHRFSTLIGSDTPVGYLFTAGNQVPLKDNIKDNLTEVMDFTDIADVSEGTLKLGVARGDVDNLGNIFNRGLGERTTLGHISQLSFLLKHFFSSTANLVFPAEKKEFIVYSGGDDFFVIGPWNRLIDDLTHFRQEFKTYTCGNTAFSFSASFSLFDSGYPAFKFAEVAGDEESKAKENRAGEKVKDSISFLGKVVFWDDFYYLKDVEEGLVKMIQDDDIRKSYIQLLRRIAQYTSLGRVKPKNDLEILEVKQSARFFRWKWYYVWQAARLMERLEKKDTAKYRTDIEPQLKEIDNFLFSSTYRSYRFIQKDSLYLIEIPARWAEFKTKK